MDWEHFCPKCKRKSPHRRIFCSTECLDAFSKYSRCKICREEGCIVDRVNYAVIDYCQKHVMDAISELSEQKMYGIHNARRLRNVVERQEYELEKEKKRRREETGELKKQLDEMKKDVEESKAKKEKIAPEEMKVSEFDKFINLLYVAKTLSQVGPQ